MGSDRGLFLNSLSPAAGSRTQRRRVGRGTGSNLGKTAGRGHKGQRSRSGHKIGLTFEGGQMPLHQRLPKFGFSSRIGRRTASIRTAALNRLQGDEVSMDSLRSQGLLRRDMLRARIYLAGEIKRPFKVTGIRVTKGARLLIEAAGGSIVTNDTKKTPAASSSDG